MDIKKQAEQYAEKFRLIPQESGWYQQKVDDFTAGYEAALRQFAVSGSLQDRLFELANDFAIDKQGDVAVKLHSIHNGLRQPLLIKSVCNGKDIRCDNPSMDRNGNCRNCEGDMQTVL